MERYEDARKGEGRDGIAPYRTEWCVGTGRCGNGGNAMMQICEDVEM